MLDYMVLSMNGNKKIYNFYFSKIESQKIRIYCNGI